MKTKLKISFKAQQPLDYKSFREFDKGDLVVDSNGVLYLRIYDGIIEVTKGSQMGMAHLAVDGDVPAVRMAPIGTVVVFAVESI
jgi:hypothetical protein